MKATDLYDIETAVLISLLVFCVAYQINVESVLIKGIVGFLNSLLIMRLLDPYLIKAVTKIQHNKRQ